MLCIFSFPYYRGVLLGAAVGNCLGSPFEFKETPSLETLIAFFNELGIYFYANIQLKCNGNITSNYI